MHRLWLGVLSAAVVVGAAVGQDTTSSDTTTETQGDTITIRRTETRDNNPCGPISSRLDADRCEAALTPTRTIYVLVGTTKTIEFDRPLREIRITDDTNRSIDIVPGTTNSTAVVSAMGEGRVNAFFFGPDEGYRKKAATPLREVLLAVTIVAVTDYDAAEPPRNVRVFSPSSKRDLRDGTQYSCTSFGCENPVRWAPGR